MGKRYTIEGIENVIKIKIKKPKENKPIERFIITEQLPQK